MYDDLIKRLNEYSAEHQQHGGIAAEAADAIESLSEDNAALDGTIENLLEQIKDFGKPRWISVEERLPEIKDRYLTVSIEPWFGTTVVDTMRWSGVWMYDGRQTEATVTHWMPLPKPPKEET